jgi:hypothetical protein
MPVRRRGGREQRGVGIFGGREANCEVVGLVYKPGKQAAVVGQIGVVCRVRGCCCIYVYWWV